MTDRLPAKTLRWRTLAGVGAVLALSAVTAVGTGCEPAPRTDAAPPTIVLDDVTLRHYGKDGTLRVGRADEVTFRRDKGRLEGSSITIDVPPTAEMARGGSHLEAGTGSADLKGHKASVAGGVHVTTGLGDEGNTDAAEWDQATDTIVGEGAVHARGPGYAVDSNGFSFRVSDQRLELGSGVQILTQPEVARSAE